MNKLYLNNDFVWEEIIKTPLSLEIAKIKAPKISDADAANQIATALHEAIHFIYAVWFDIYVNFAGVSTKKYGTKFWKGYKTQGMVLAYDYNEGWPAIYSTCAAAIFELELNNKEANELIMKEFDVALHAAKHLRWPDPYDEDTTGMILRNVLNKLTANQYSAERGPIGHVWWLIRSVAIALLVSRTKTFGVISSKKIVKIRQFIHKYVRSEKYGPGEYFPEFRLRTTMTEDIKWLKNSFS